MKSKMKSKLKSIWIDVPKKDLNYWLGQYLVSSMVLHAYTAKDGCPNRIGKIGDMKTQKDGTGLIPYQAQWD